ncbi:hypothetical protein ScPMuIL_002343 [Solemya velum]
MFRRRGAWYLALVVVISMCVVTQVTLSRDRGRHTRHRVQVEELKEFQPIPVVIVTYMRSGSTLTGDILQQDPNSFYMYEPFRNLKNAIDLQKPFFLSDGTSTMLESDNFVEMSREIFSSLLGCEVEKLPLSLLRDSFMNAGIKTEKYLKCLSQTRHWQDNKRHRICNPMLQKFCSQSKILLFKAIRHPLDFFEEYLNKNPSMKIIHLVRDPRATLQSQVLAAKFPVDTFKMAAKEHCDRVIEDIETFNRIKEKHPASIVRIYYEDLAKYPIETARTMYDFIGMDYTEGVMQYILDITSRGLPDGCSICSQRADSQMHINKWRKQMPYERAQLIDNQCSGVYERLGYIPVISELALDTVRYPLLKKQHNT